MRHVIFGLSVLFASAVIAPAVAQAQVIDIAFPVQGTVTFQDDFLDSRGGGRLHYAIDIMGAEKMTPVFAAVDGVIDFAPMSEPYYGYMISLEGDDGFTYSYVHLNNDTPGTDDGAGGPEHAYVAGIEEGVRVDRGQHIAWLGDSGNAENVGPHLHFEIYDGETPINPYESLVAAYAVKTFDPELKEATVETINQDKDIEEADGEVNCESDTLIRTEEVSTVYYCGRDGGRYVFQNESTFYSWYDNFDDVQYVSTDVMASIPLNGVVTYKPGSYMVKILSSPKIYAVAKGGVLRWIPSAEIAEATYGANWATYVRDIPDAFWPAYEVGDEVSG